VSYPAKPRLHKLPLVDVWHCRSELYLSDTEMEVRLGVGDTPADAYRSWVMWHMAPPARMLRSVSYAQTR